MRNAISGDRSLRSFKKAENACRVTPRALAASVTLRPSGLITSSRTISPGWGGSVIGPTPPVGSSVIVDEIDIENSSLFETEDHPSVAGGRHTPEACQITGERV
jgi:hypothetical protein